MFNFSERGVQPDLNFKIIRLARVRFEFDTRLLVYALFSNKRAITLKTEAASASEALAAIYLRDVICPITLEASFAPLKAPSISRTFFFIKLGISFIKSRQCSQHNVVT